MERSEASKHADVDPHICAVPQEIHSIIHGLEGCSTSIARDDGGYDLDTLKIIKSINHDSTQRSSGNSF